MRDWRGAQTHLMMLAAMSLAWNCTAISAGADVALVGPPLPDAGTTLISGADGGSAAANAGDAGAEQAEPEAASIALPVQERLSLGRDRSVRGAAAGGSDLSDGRGSIIDHWAVRTIGALAIVIGMALLLRTLARSVAGHAGGVRGQLGAGGRAPSGVMSVLARFPIARGQTLVLLQLDRRVLLLNQTPAGFATLTEMVDAEEVASIVRKCEAGSRGERDGTNGFGSVLRAMERDPEVGTGRLDGVARARSVTTRPAEETHDDPVGRAQALLRATRRGNAAMGGGVA